MKRMAKNKLLCFGYAKAKIKFSVGESISVVSVQNNPSGRKILNWNELKSASGSQDDFQRLVWRSDCVTCYSQLDVRLTSLWHKNLDVCQIDIRKTQTDVHSSWMNNGRSTPDANNLVLVVWYLLLSCMNTVFEMHLKTI